MKPKDALVLIAAYDEEKNIGGLIGRVREQGFDVLVVDDGSRDGTSRAAAAAGAEVLRSEKNQGKGASIRKGVGRFLEGGRQALIFMDADGQHEAEELSIFLRALYGSDLVVGNRMGDPTGMPWLRRLTNRAMSDVISTLSRRRVPDTQCGYRAARREALAKMRLVTDRFEIESEMILEAGRTGASVVSVPIRSVYDGGPSHIRPLRDTARFLTFLFLYFLRSR